METLRNNAGYLGLGLCATGLTAVAVRKVLAQRDTHVKPRVCGVDYPRDTVMVHQFSKGDFAPSISHFVVKLETYLRINKIPYEPVYGLDFGPKRKVPWIEYNGLTMGDSQLIINFLNKKFNVNLNKSLDKEQRAIAWAIQKWIEEYTFHLNIYTRYILLWDDWQSYIPTMPHSMRHLIQTFVPVMQHYTGTARHSKQEIHDFMAFDMRQLSAILGDKKFMMGGQGPTEVDCAVFGILSQVRWETPDSCPGKQVLTKECSNVMAYMDRIKQLYWPDWNERITGGDKSLGRYDHQVIHNPTL